MIASSAPLSANAATSLVAQRVEGVCDSVPPAFVMVSVTAEVEILLGFTKAEMCVLFAEPNKGSITPVSARLILHEGTRVLSESVGLQ